VAGAQKFPVRDDSRVSRKRGSPTNCRVGLKGNAHSTLERFCVDRPKTQY
jgi:hypothetical protein